MIHACTETNERKTPGFTHRLTGTTPCPRAGGPDPGRNTSGPPPGRADLGLSTCVSVSAHPPPPPPAMSSPGMNDRGPPPLRADLGVSTCSRPRRIVTISLTVSVALSPTISVHTSVVIPLSLCLSPYLSLALRISRRSRLRLPLLHQGSTVMCSRARAHSRTHATGVRFRELHMTVCL